MQAVKLKAHIRSDTTLEWDEPLPKLPPGEVEVIVLYEQATTKEQSRYGSELSSEQPQSTQSPRSNQSGKKQDGFWIDQLCDTLSDVTKAIGIEELQQHK